MILIINGVLGVMGEAIAAFLEWAKGRTVSETLTLWLCTLVSWAFVEDFLRPILRTLGALASAALERLLAGG